MLEYTGDSLSVSMNVNLTLLIVILVLYCILVFVLYFIKSNRIFIDFNASIKFWILRINVYIHGK